MKSFISRIGLIFFVALLSLGITVAAAFAANGSVKTTSNGCAAPVNQNTYENGQTISIYGDNFPTGATTWQIVPVNSACDAKNIAIVSGNLTIGSGSCSVDGNDSLGSCVAGAAANGHQFCFAAYVVGTGGTIPEDCGIYKFQVDSKTDNYSVEALATPTPTPGPSASPTPTPSPTPSLTINKVGHESGGNLVYTVVLHNGGGAATDGNTDVVDNFGSEMSYVGFSGSGWDCSASVGEVDCTYGPVIGAGNDSSTLTLTFQPSPFPTTRTCYTNFACIGASPCSSAAPCFGSQATAVPTMTDWGIILFAFLAGMASIFYLRKRKKNI